MKLYTSYSKSTNFVELVFTFKIQRDYGVIYAQICVTNTRDYHFIHYIAELKKKYYFDVRIEALFIIMSLIIQIS